MVGGDGCASLVKDDANHQHEREVLENLEVLDKGDAQLMLRESESQRQIYLLGIR